MTSERPGRPDAVIGPEGAPMTLQDLPPPGTKRWVIRRKAEVVAGVRAGLITIEEACERYTLSMEEFLSWQKLIDRHGLRGLRVALFEKEDYGSGTSSKSSKLIHGGLRYLEQGEIGLVFESVSERRVQEHVRAIRAGLGRGVFRLVVADPVLARHEDHRGRHDARQVDGIVAGAAHDLARRQTERGGRLAHGRDAVGVERHGRRVPDLL